MIAARCDDWRVSVGCAEVARAGARGRIGNRGGCHIAARQENNGAARLGAECCGTQFHAARDNGAQREQRGARRGAACPHQRIGTGREATAGTGALGARERNGAERNGGNETEAERGNEIIRFRVAHASGGLV